MTFQMMCIITFFIAVGAVALSLGLGILVKWAMQTFWAGQSRASVSRFKFCIVGVFVACCAIYYPISYHRFFDNGPVWQVFKAVLVSVFHGIRMFLLDGELQMIEEFFLQDGYAIDSAWQTAYTVCSTALGVISPLFTVGFVLSFFRDLWGSICYHVPLFSDVYLISELNERSIALAQSIATHPSCKGKKQIVFANVFGGQDEEQTFELIAEARNLGAILFKKDVCHISLRYLFGKRRKIYLIGEDEDENVRQALSIITHCRRVNRYNRKTTQCYVFATNAESEIMLNAVDNGEMKVRRVNEKHNMILQTLCEHSIFENAVATRKGKMMNILIVGLGSYGTEFLKACCWCGQMIGYVLNVHVFDREGNGEQKIRAIAPDLIAHNHKEIEGDAYYNLYFHDNVDVNSYAFFEEISALDCVTTAFVTLGEDQRNIETAMTLRMQFGRDARTRGSTIPPIFAVVYSSLKSDIVESNGGLQSVKRLKGRRQRINGAVDHSKSDYGIYFVGSAPSRYSIDVIEQQELEEEGRQCHLRWATSESQLLEKVRLYEKYEYYRRSSIAEAVHLRFCRQLGILKRPGNSPEDLAFNEKITVLEHARWNAYMRAEGYIHCEGEADDIAKIHPNLVPYDELPSVKRNKDAAVSYQSRS